MNENRRVATAELSRLTGASNPPPGGRRPDEPPQGPGPVAFFGVLILLVSIASLFAVIVIAFMFRGTTDLGPPVPAPRLLWLSTGVLVASSLTLELARAKIRRVNVSAYLRWFRLSAVLGVAFLVTQTLVWSLLNLRGFYAAENARVGFLYIVAGLHAAHLIAGLVLYARGLMRGINTTSSIETIEAETGRAGLLAIYWHAMGAIWLVVFGIVVARGL